GDPTKALHTLTTTIQGAMEREVVHVERIDTAALARAVEALYRGELERELWGERAVSGRHTEPSPPSGSIAEAIEHFRQQDPERIERFWQRILGYHAGLAAYRRRDAAVRTRLERMAKRQRGARSSQALLASIVTCPLFWSLETLLVWWVAGLRWALAFFLSLPLGGLIAYRYVIGTGRVRHRVRFGALL